MVVLDGLVKEATDEEVKQAALDWINGIREEYGLIARESLPKGRRGAGAMCVLANAARGISDRSATWMTNGRSSWQLDGAELPIGLHFAQDGQIITRPIPSLVEEFICRFDAGKFPDLIAM